jgi:hypothetical protein
MRNITSVLKDMVFIAISIFVLTLAANCFAEDYLERDDIVDVEVAFEKDIDNIVILLDTKTVVIRTTLSYLDEEDYVVRTEAGELIILRDVEDDLETPEDETLTEYTDFFQSLGINKAALRTAIKVALGIE